jgi:hypothetical protein
MLPNFIVVPGLGSLALLLAVFGAALMDLRSGEVATALATIIAAVIGGAFVLAAALIAWRSVQARIDAEEHAERHAFQLAITAELLVFSGPVIRGASNWNQNAHQDPASRPASWPMLPQPRVYDALVSRIGLIEGWVASAVISFYGSLLDLNDLSREEMQDRPTPGENIGTIAERFQSMAMSLADSLDGLNPNRQFPVMGHDLTILIRPDGTTVADTALPPPTSLQALLRALGRS